MQILAVDIGTGTQDILFYDSHLDIENSYKLVLPSPTMIIHHRLREATRRWQPVLLSGVTMGGGPSQWAAEAHIRAGLSLYATPDAARTFNDDLEEVSALGVKVISEDEAVHLPGEVLRLELRDFDFIALRQAFAQFGVSLDNLSAVAIAVFDHGNAPPGYSDRQFRFDYLDARLRSANRLTAFAYLSANIPASMTRLQAIAKSAGSVAAPLVVMDTAPAAVLGATFDPHVAARPRLLVANVGNFHTLAFRLGPQGVEGLFEHHTGLLDLRRLQVLLRSLADGSLTHAEVFAENGHGALIYTPEQLSLGEGDFDVVITGPRRAIFYQSSPTPLRPYFAAPFGDMMIGGCFGLLAAVADLMPTLADPIRTSLQDTGRRATAPWEVF